MNTGGPVSTADGPMTPLLSVLSAIGSRTPEPQCPLYTSQRLAVLTLLPQRRQPPERPFILLDHIVIT